MIKPKYTAETLKEIEKYAEDGLWEKDIATLIGYNPTWFSEIKSKYPDITEAIKKGRTKFKAYLLSKIRVAGENSNIWTANAWLLERMFSEEFAPKSKHEVAGKDGEAINLNIKVNVKEV